MLKRPLIAIYIISAVLLSCRSTKPAATVSKPNGSAKDYIENYKDLAISEMKRTGVPASITLAQGMLESGMGKSTLATEANNHFGIKCHDNWTGPTVRHHDDRRNECFRKYSNPAESYRDHSDFLKNTPRYKFLFELEATDYKGWARGLKKAGYATNPDYANMLIERIEQYGLYDFDNVKKSTAVASGKNGASVNNNVIQDTSELIPDNSAGGQKVYFKSLPARVKENNRIQYIVVGERDTKESIENELNLLGWEIQRYNELEPGFSLTPGQIIYLQPKRDKAEAGKDYHMVKEGETMYLISQIYGIKLRNLYQMNRMTSGTEPKQGDRLWLRSTRPVN
jgi:LysM repeat protein